MPADDLNTKGAAEPCPADRNQAGAAPTRRQRGKRAPALDPICYRVDDACAVAGLGRTTMYGLIAAGEVQAIKAKGRTLVVAVSLRRYLAGLPAL